MSKVEFVLVCKFLVSSLKFLEFYTPKEKKVMTPERQQLLVLQQTKQKCITAC